MMLKRCLQWPDIHIEDSWEIEDEGNRLDNLLAKSP